MTTDERRFILEVDEDLTEIYRAYEEDVTRLYRLVRNLVGALTVLFVIVTLNIYATLGGYLTPFFITCI